VSARRALAAQCDDSHLIVTLADGRVLRAPLWWYPRLLSAPPDGRAVNELSPLGIHWPEVDEDISVASILRGRTEAQPPRKDGTAAVEGLQSRPGGN
jgi:hypothetical protein